MANHRFSRAQRRHHYARLKRARHHYWGGVPEGWETDHIWCAQRLARLTRTPRPCSCFLCRSPRKDHGNGWGALTVQEQRQRTIWAEGCEEGGPLEADPVNDREGVPSEKPAGAV